MKYIKDKFGIIWTMTFVKDTNKLKIPNKTFEL